MAALPGLTSVVKERMDLLGLLRKPQASLRLADENRLLAAGDEQWELYVQTRIDTTHDYDREKAASAIGLMPEFIGDAIKLYTAMTGELWE